MAPTHEMVANCGYQTPDEHSNRPSYFATPNESPLASLPLPRSPLRRPPFVPRSSHGPAFETEDSTAMPPAERQAESNESSPNNAKATLEKHFSLGKVGIRDRIACHTWTWFTMATGGMANVIHSLPYQAAWLNGIAVAFFLLNVILFIMNCALASIRFKSRPGALTHSFTDQTESLFIPSAVVSFAIISINICQFGVPHVGPWLLRIMQILFWFYIALSVLASATIYLILWSTLIFPIHTMTPTWVFPAYPLLLTAPFASNLIQAAVQTNQQVVTLNRTAIALCAVATQGAGCLIAFMISAAFIYRLMTQKLPRDFQRPGVFISIGPFAFTVGGLVQLGNSADKILPSNFLGTDLAVPIIKVMSVLIGLWLWGLSMWFFIVSVGSLWKYSSNAGATKTLPIHTREQSEATIQPKSSHVADDFLQSFLDPSFDPAAYLNATLPLLQHGGYHSSRSNGNGQAVPLADLSNEAQTLLSQLNIHTTRLSGTLTQLTDDILRSGSRLAYEVELLRGETLSLAETMNETLQEDIKKFAPSGVDQEAKGTVPKAADGQDRRESVGASKPGDDEATATEGKAETSEPPYIHQLRTLTVVRSRLDTVIKTFGDAMEFVFPPSELSVSSSFLSVSAPDPGAEQHSTEEKGQQVLQGLRDEISQLLTKSEDPVKGIEKAAQRIEELKELNKVWKGTAEEKGRTKFIESLAKMVEDRHRDLMREVDQASRRDGNEGRARKGSVHADAAETKTYLGGYGLMSQLQKLRNGL
ncbi:C4-dicarboxylate transporter/malic acid transporter [Colletotrichum scovillei]|uniref:C4-dicarboxylate transporter/malic acid transporter n=1 Tax=Colletotrichum scovillei TaxID=1209932 RepID=A0A9P7RD82_9PEZI|nr:C4-dicarboxylate transporter/malic acid transporter [Colletotrichum scovillei]KAG7072340.1 C4-dicarboxylate transporter/malic acid transporter [Colletotrichum scovillei]KAG7080749.1 C4-dicarboxylate transporter/malic acid transporter [Colletotrichum scovillei]